MRFDSDISLLPSTRNIPMEAVCLVGQYHYMEKDPFAEPFLKRLRDVIDADPNLTVAGLAVKAGLNNSVIRAWFAGNGSPKLETARKICEALDTTLEAFLSEARSAEEKEIVRLATLLPEHLRRQLLGYGQGLLAAEDQTQQPTSEA